MKDTQLFPLKEKENLLPLCKFLDLDIKMSSKKLMELIMMEILEKIPNGTKMDQESPQLLMLFISDFQDTIFTTLKLILIWLY